MLQKVVQQFNKPSRFSHLASDKAVEVMEFCNFYKTHTRTECAEEYARLYKYFLNEYERGRMRPD